MSKRISQTYDGFLSYMTQKESMATPKKQETASGLGARMKRTSASPTKGKYSELDKVAEIVQSIREYRKA